MGWKKMSAYQMDFLKKRSENGKEILQRIFGTILRIVTIDFLLGERRKGRKFDEEEEKQRTGTKLKGKKERGFWLLKGYLGKRNCVI